MMNILGGLILAIMSFLLGLIASAYGARVGRAMEARKEILNQIGEWVDKSLEEAHYHYQQVLGASDRIWSDEEQREFFKLRTAMGARMLGLARAIANEDLSSSIQDFMKSVLDFESVYKRTAPTDVLKDKRKIQGLRSALNGVDDEAEYLYSVIGNEILKGILTIDTLKKHIRQIFVD